MITALCLSMYLILIISPNFYYRALSLMLELIASRSITHLLILTLPLRYPNLRMCRRIKYQAVYIQMQTGDNT
jgi:hypothetical protein